MLATKNDGGQFDGKRAMIGLHAFEALPVLQDGTSFLSTSWFIVCKTDDADDDADDVFLTSRLRKADDDNDGQQRRDTKWCVRAWLETLFRDFINTSVTFPKPRLTNDQARFLEIRIFPPCCK